MAVKIWHTPSSLLFLQQLFFQLLYVILQFGVLHHQFLLLSDAGLNDCNEANPCYPSALNSLSNYSIHLDMNRYDCNCILLAFSFSSWTCCLRYSMIWSASAARCSSRNKGLWLDILIKERAKSLTDRERGEKKTDIKQFYLYGRLFEFYEHEVILYVC